ncbi:hypothetical protein HGRIS_002634 [Hohenbuehelia grisea]|uniref:Metallo-beta-lactamase domain-containing protein n=1 Tax=Hohenbuehelia grisea TaxID=104357 RepID=A0ABR3JL41_9AGAR
MTTLPPGFTHELRTHLRSHNPPVDETTGVPILDFNKFCCGAHGFAALIETQVDGDAPQVTLFDTGPDVTSLVRNIDSMHVPVEKIERVIISHWHSDHTGGLLSFLDLRDSEAHACVVDVHPSRPLLRGIAPGPQFNKIICALPRDPSFDDIVEHGGILEQHATGHTVADDTVWVSGEVPRVTEFETGILGGMRWTEDGTWKLEPHIMDERYAVIDVAGKGLVILSACSHSGIVNVVKDAVATFQRPIYMVRIVFPGR